MLEKNRFDARSEYLFIGTVALSIVIELCNIRALTFCISSFLIRPTACSASVQSAGDAAWIVFHHTFGKGIVRTWSSSLEEPQLLIALTKNYLSLQYSFMLNFRLVLLLG